MTIPLNAITSVAEQLLRFNAIKATKYLSPTHIIRATRKRYGGKIISGTIEMVISIGRPNYIERDFIKDCKKAGEPFPVKRVQLKLYNPKRTAPKKRK